MIRARFAVAVALLLSLAALALAFAAFMSTVRETSEKPGRLLQTRISNAYEGAPLNFPLDDFIMSRDQDGVLHALYVYPPGFFGHARGCRVVWIGDEVPEGADAQTAPGLFVDPCGGARFGRDGRLVSGPADHGLDYFSMNPGVDGFVVDTRTLWCGRLYGVTYPDDPTSTATPFPLDTATPPPPGAATATRTVFGAPTAAPTVTATPTTTATATPEGTITATLTPDLGPKKCQRVTGSSKR